MRKQDAGATGPDDSLHAHPKLSDRASLAVMAAAGLVAPRRPAYGPDFGVLVIVVDDDAAVRGAMAAALRDHDFDVAEASTGEAALGRMRRAMRPAVLVVDVNLGAGMTGLEVADSLQADAGASEVLLVSGDDSLPRRAIGRFAFLAKPFSTNALIAHVNALAARLLEVGPGSPVFRGDTV
jgi:CheY-like chemotaxis protein